MRACNTIWDVERLYATCCFNGQCGPSYQCQLFTQKKKSIILLYVWLLQPFQCSAIKETWKMCFKYGNSYALVHLDWAMADNCYIFWNTANDCGDIVVVMVSSNYMRFQVPMLLLASHNGVVRLPKRLVADTYSRGKACLHSLVSVDCYVSVCFNLSYDDDGLAAA